MAALWTHWAQMLRIPDVVFPVNNFPIRASFAKQIFHEDVVQSVVKDYAKLGGSTWRPRFHDAELIPDADATSEEVAFVHGKGHIGFGHPCICFIHVQFCEVQSGFACGCKSGGAPLLVMDAPWFALGSEARVMYDILVPGFGSHRQREVKALKTLHLFFFLAKSLKKNCRKHCRAAFYRAVLISLTITIWT
tara:strand:- start:115 stop:690 length:576 start_codon:yes stop_codon:yes gene_type:complete